jgi:hypothetical protein
MFEYEFFLNSVPRVTLGSMVLGYWAARWGRLGRLSGKGRWGSTPHAENKKKKKEWAARAK